MTKAPRSIRSHLIHKERLDFLHYTLGLLRNRPLAIFLPRNLLKVIQSFYVKRTSWSDNLNNQISEEVFNHLVGLSALELNPDEAEYLRQQLNQQLQVIEQLKAIELDENVPANLHGISYDRLDFLPIREDILKPYSDPQSILSQAPQTQDGYLIVPDIPHTTL